MPCNDGGFGYGNSNSKESKGALALKARVMKDYINVGLHDYADVAFAASANGHGDYNDIITLMRADGMIPGYEHAAFDLYIGVGKDYGYSPELCRILDAYVVQFGESTISL